MYQKQYMNMYEKIQNGKWNTQKGIGLKEVFLSIIGAGIGTIIYYKMHT